MADYPNHETVVSIDTAKEILKILDKIYCEEIQKELMWTLLYLLKLVENIDEEYIIGHEHYLDEIKYMIDNPPEDEYSLLPVLRILKELLISHEENAEILYHMDILKSVLHLELSKPDVVKA